MVLTNFSGGVSAASTITRGAVHAAIASAATEKKYRWYERINPRPSRLHKFQCSRKQRRRCRACFDQFSSIEGTPPRLHGPWPFPALPKGLLPVTCRRLPG